MTQETPESQRDRLAALLHDLDTRDSAEVWADRLLAAGVRAGEPCPYCQRTEPHDHGTAYLHGPDEQPHPGVRVEDEGLREALHQALDRFDTIGEHLKPDATDHDRHAVAQAWWFGSEEIRAAIEGTER